MKAVFYAYFIVETQECGIVRDWKICSQRVAGKKSQFQKFQDYRQAIDFLSSFSQQDLSSDQDLASLSNSLFFDSGTGRGSGVEVSVTNHGGEDVLKEIIDLKYLTTHGTYLIPNEKKATNNYGELLALFFALKIAQKNKTYVSIFGDSQLVIQYWSLKIYNKRKLLPATISLIEKVSQCRQQFELHGGRVNYIEGGKNPADLGFHSD